MNVAHICNLFVAMIFLLLASTTVMFDAYKPWLHWVSRFDSPSFTAAKQSNPCPPLFQAFIEASLDHFDSALQSCLLQPHLAQPIIPLDLAIITTLIIHAAGPNEAKIKKKFFELFSSLPCLLALTKPEGQYLHHKKTMIMRAIQLINDDLKHPSNATFTVANISDLFSVLYVRHPDSVPEALQALTSFQLHSQFVGLAALNGVKSIAAATIKNYARVADQMVEEDFVTGLSAEMRFRAHTTIQFILQLLNNFNNDYGIVNAVKEGIQSIDPGAAISENKPSAQGTVRSTKAIMEDLIQIGRNDTDFKSRFDFFDNVFASPDSLTQIRKHSAQLFAYFEAFSPKETIFQDSLHFEFISASLFHLKMLIIENPDLLYEPSVNGCILVIARCINQGLFGDATALKAIRMLMK